MGIYGNTRGRKDRSDAALRRISRIYNALEASSLLLGMAHIPSPECIIEIVPVEPCAVPILVDKLL